MPVLHKGYLDLFDRVKPEVIALLTEEVLRDLPEGLSYIAKKDSIRAVPSKEMWVAVSSLFSSQEVTVMRATVADISSLGGNSHQILMPDEDVSLSVAEKYFGVGRVTFVTPPSRLRYHRNNVEEKKLLVPDRRLPLSNLDREMMAIVGKASERSPDWWRQVGGVLVTPDGRSIVAYNEHQPHEQIAATLGDPRSIFKSGVRTDLSNAEHVERIVIGEAARQKIGTDNSILYLTTFPCLPCAHLMARAGVKRLFYRDPSYGLLDADEFLRGKEIELIEVSDGT